MIRKSLHILLWFLLLAGVAVLLGFARESNNQAPCRQLDIQVISRSGNPFVRPETIREAITGQFDSLVGRSLNRDIMGRLHRLVQAMPHVHRADVYRTIDGELKVDAWLRDPIVRVVNRANESFYIDTDGYMFPLSGEYTARVMLASGNIGTAFQAGKNVRETPGREKAGAMEALHDVYRLADYIHRDPFWLASIDHIVVRPDGKYELIPGHGAHIIEFGEASDLEEKFNKLKLFYKHGLTRVGWHSYSRVNLEYRQQVICSK